MLSEELKVGTSIRIGKQYALDSYGRFKEGQVITLVEGTFEEYNGLYSWDSYAPSIPCDEDEGEFDSIWHLFGNSLDKFLDCEIISKTENK